MSADSLDINNEIPVTQLVADLRAAGIAPGDNLIVHSSLKKIGRVENGANGVVRALLDAIGDTGNLMVPAFTYSLPIWSGQPFDVACSKSRVGAVTEAVRAWPNARRSFHPTHSVVVIGPDARELTLNHMHSSPIGKDSPFGRMHKRGAKILMLGTFQDTNSSLHYCEVMAGLPYIEVPFTSDQDFEVAWFFNESGQIEYTEIREMPGCSRGFRVIEPMLKERGVLKETRVGEAPCQLLEMEKFVAAAIEILQEDPILLLCSTPGCIICPKRLERMKKP